MTLYKQYEDTVEGAILCLKENSSLKNIIEAAAAPGSLSGEWLVKYKIEKNRWDAAIVYMKGYRDVFRSFREVNDFEFVDLKEGVNYEFRSPSN